MPSEGTLYNKCKHGRNLLYVYDHNDNGQCNIAYGHKGNYHGREVCYALDASEDDNQC